MISTFREKINQSNFKILYQLDIESIRLKKCQVELVETGAMSTRLRQAQADSMISVSNLY